MKKSTFIEGTIIATLAIVFTKVLGMLYVIPFYAIIGAQGSALYSYAYNIYVIFLNISSAGIPVAMSKLVSEYDTKNMKEAKVRSLKLGITIISVISIICFLLMMIYAEQIARTIIGDLSGGNTIEDIALVLRAVSFAVLVIPFLSVARGYLQGHKFIAISSFSQMLEQVIRIIVILAGSFIVITLLKKEVSLGVAVAISGAFISGLVAIIYIFKKIFDNKKELDLGIPLKKDAISNKTILKKILTYAIPFIIINVTVNFFNIIDMTFIVRTLGKLGFTGAEAEFVSSAMTTWGYKLNMIVNAIATGLTISLIPNLVSAYTLKKNKEVNQILNRAFQIVLFISMPAAIGLSFLAEPVWTMFYGVSSLGPVIFKLSILTSILCNVYLIAIQSAQSINEYKTVYKAVIFGFSMNAIFDIPFMYICNYLKWPAFYGATFATILGYIVAIGIVIRKLKKIEGISFKTTIRRGAKILFCVGIMVLCLSLLKLVFPYNMSPSKAWATIYVAIYAGIGALIYFFLTYKLNLIKTIFGPAMIKKILNKMTFGRIKIKGDMNDNPENC